MLLPGRVFAPPVLLWAAAAALAASEPDIRVGPNVQVSRARDRIAHNEILLAADPNDPARLLGCSMAFDPARNRTFTIVYASSDGGQTWAPTLETADLEFSGDPTCALGRNARAYYMALGVKPGGKISNPIYRSEDSGRRGAPRSC
jgi:hypothetical protein